MLTYGQLLSQIRRKIWPTGEAPNLVPAHNQDFLSCLIELQTFVPCLQQQHTNIIPACATLYQCGLTVFDQPPHSIVRKVYVIDKTATLPSGVITATKTGNQVVTSEPFFDDSMIGSIIEFADGQAFVIQTFVDTMTVIVKDPATGGVTAPTYTYLGRYARINPGGDLELYDRDDQKWHAVEVVGPEGDVQLGPEQTGSST